MHGLREEAISHFHDLLAADETLSPVVFEKLRTAMRKKRLLYGERPIGVALRPHLLHHEAIPETEPRCAARHECVGKGCSRSGARSEPDG